MDADAVAEGPEFVGVTACVSCHEERVASYRETAHFRTLRAAVPGDVAGAYASTPSVMATRNPRLRFEMSEEDGSLWQTAVMTTDEGVVRRRERVDLVMGSGRIFEGYLTWRGDALFQLPVGHMSSRDRWSNCPGFLDGTADFDRAIRPRCLDCHGGWIDHVEGSVNRYDREHAVLGMSCERCHGPGRDHVVHHARHPEDRVAHGVVHPGDLTREQRLQLCGQCHGDPGTLRKPAFSYRPGDPLDEYVEQSREVGADEFVHTANQVQRLGASACFADERLECISCHDPHRSERDDIVSRSRRACIECHGTAGCGAHEETPEPLRGDCVACHMPRHAVVDTTFSTAGDDFVDALRMAEHRIGVHDRASTSHLLSWLNREGGDADRAARVRDDLVKATEREARARFAERRFVESLSLWRSVLELDPSHPSAAEQARRSMAAARRADAARGHVRSGARLLDSGDVEGAMAAYLRALAEDANAPEAYAGVGRAALARGDLDGAVTAFERSLALRPDHGATRNGLGQALAAAGRTTEAAAAFEFALKAGVESARVNLANALSGLGRFEEAIEHYREHLADEPEDADVGTNLAVALGRTGRRAQAVEILERILGRDPESAAAHHALGGLLADQGDFERALEHFEEAQLLAPDLTAPLNEAARVLAARGRVQEALGLWMRSLTVDGAQADIHYLAARAMLQQGHRRDGRRHAVAAIGLAPGRPEARVLLVEDALGFLGAPAEPARAVEEAEVLCRVHAGVPAFLELRARALIAAGSWDAAEASATEALERLQGTGDRGLVTRLNRLLQEIASRRPAGEGRDERR